MKQFLPSKRRQRCHESIYPNNPDPSLEQITPMCNNIRLICASPDWAWPRKVGVSLKNLLEFQRIFTKK